MAIDALPPSPQTTLLILLGASSWPEYDEFSSSKAFANIASEVRSYFLNQFGLVLENLLDLFDSEKNAIEQDREIAKFLVKRSIAMKLAENAARDIVLYFVGHGGFSGNDSKYYLAIRATSEEHPGNSGFQVDDLAHTLKEKARHQRCLLILDCCFAGSAFQSFLAGPSEIAINYTVNAFEVNKKKGKGFPGKGITLLCSCRTSRYSRRYSSGTDLIPICGFLLLFFIFVFIVSLHQAIPFLAWLSIGIFPALIVSMVIHESGMDTIGNIVVGGIGSCGAGYLVTLVIPWPGIAFWVSIIVAFIGACILLAIFRGFAGSRH